MMRTTITSSRNHDLPKQQVTSPTLPHYFLSRQTTKNENEYAFPFEEDPLLLVPPIKVWDPSSSPSPSSPFPLFPPTVIENTVGNVADIWKQTTSSSNKKEEEEENPTPLSIPQIVHLLGSISSSSSLSSETDEEKKREEQKGDDDDPSSLSSSSVNFFQQLILYSKASNRRHPNTPLETRWNPQQVQFDSWDGSAPTSLLQQNFERIYLLLHTQHILVGTLHIFSNFDSFLSHTEESNHVYLEHMKYHTTTTTTNDTNRTNHVSHSSLYYDGLVPILVVGYESVSLTSSLLLSTQDLQSDPHFSSSHVLVPCWKVILLSLSSFPSFFLPVFPINAFSQIDMPGSVPIMTHEKTGSSRQGGWVVTLVPHAPPPSQKEHFHHKNQIVKNRDSVDHPHHSFFWSPLPIWMTILVIALISIFLLFLYRFYHHPKQWKKETYTTTIRIDDHKTRKKRKRTKPSPLLRNK